MNSTHNVLLQLLKLSLGNIEQPSYTQDDISWSEVFHESRHQGVACVACDAFEHIRKKYRPEQKLLLEWLGSSINNESIYRSYVDTICQLSGIVSRLGMRMLLLKGYGCSLNYPIPSHRPCGDIDIFLIDDDGKHTDKLSELLESYLVQEYNSSIKHPNGHHSQFIFGGFLVENHSHILDLDAHKSSLFLEHILETLVTEEVREIHVGDYLLYLPSVKFNSVHLLRHMANDFATVSTSLRQVLDWSTFVASNDVDWPFICEISHRTNMNRFLDALNGICVDYLGYSEDMFPIEHHDEKLENEVLDDILISKDSVTHLSHNPSYSQKLCYSLNKTKRMWKNRWKYKIVYDENLFESFWSKVKQF